MDSETKRRLIRQIIEEHDVRHATDAIAQRLGPLMGMSPLAPGEMPDIVICVEAPPGAMLVLPDNKTGLCAWGCGRRIQWRPDMFEGVARVCLACTAERGKHLQ